MRALLYLVFLLFASFTPAQDRSPAELRREAEKQIRKGDNWEQTARLLGDLITQSTNGEVNVEAALLTQAHAYAEQTNWVEAIQALENIDRFQAADLEERLHFNRATAGLNRAAEVAATNNWEEAASKAGAAIESLEKSLTLDHKNLTAKHNLEVALQRQQFYQRALEKQQQEQQQQNEEENKDDQEEQDQEQDQQEGDSQKGDEDSEEDSSGENQPQENPEPGDEQDPGEEDEQQDSGDEEEQSNNPEDSEAPQESEAQAQPSPSEPQMTREEAERMLNALMEQEQLKRAEQQDKMRARLIPVEKNW